MTAARPSQLDVGVARVVSALDRMRGQPRDRALDILRDVREEDPGLRCELVWYEIGPSCELQYEVLIRRGDDDVISIVLASDSTTPWIMQSAGSWDDRLVLRVGQARWEVDDVLSFVDFLWKEPGFKSSMVDCCIIEEETRRRGLEVSDSELQALMDELRIRNGLLTPEDFTAWLESTGVTQERLERHLAFVGAREKLKAEVAGGREAVYFDEHRADFESWVGLEVVSSDPRRLEGVREALANGGSFDSTTRHLVVDEGVRLRSAEIVLKDLLPAERALFASAEPGDAVGPLSRGGDASIFLVMEHRPARFTAEAQAACRDALEAQWLAEQRRRADVQWYSDADTRS